MNIRASVLLCVSRTILMRRGRVLAPVSGFITTTRMHCTEAHLYLRDWMVVDYLPGEVKTFCRIPTNWQACCIIYINNRVWLANNAVAVTGTVLAAKRSGRRTVGWLRRLKRLRKAREPRLYA